MRINENMNMMRNHIAKIANQNVDSRRKIQEVRNQRLFGVQPAYTVANLVEDAIQLDEHQFEQFMNSLNAYERKQVNEIFETVIDTTYDLLDSYEQTYGLTEQNNDMLALENAISKLHNNLDCLNEARKNPKPKPAAASGPAPKQPRQPRQPRQPKPAAAATAAPATPPSAAASGPAATPAAAVSGPAATPAATPAAAPKPKRKRTKPQAAKAPAGETFAQTKERYLRALNQPVSIEGIGRKIGSGVRSAITAPFKAGYGFAKGLFFGNKPAEQSKPSKGKGGKGKKP